MTIRLLFILFFALIACKQSPPIKDTVQSIAEEHVEDKYKYCQLTAEEFGKKYLKNDVKLKNFNNCDSLLLEVISNLDKRPISQQSFWFSVLSKLAPETDGYLSEGFGIMAYEFIKENPLQFVKNVLAVEKGFPIETNLDNWTTEVYNEISISHENKERESVNIYIKRLEEDSKNFNPQEKSVIIKFCKKLKGKL